MVDKDGIDRYSQAGSEQSLGGGSLDSLGDPPSFFPSPSDVLADKDLANQLLQDALLATAPSNLESFAEFCFGFSAAPHQKIWVAALEQASHDVETRNQEGKNTAFVAPPAHGKTNWLIWWCCWQLGRRPDLHIGYIGNSATQAYKPSVAVRDTIRYSRKFKQVFPNVEPNFTKGWGESEWFLQRPNMADKDASFFASGICGPVIGARFDIIVLDDVCDQDNQATKHQRDKLRDWLEATVFSRLTPGGVIISIMTRWHEEDAMKLIKKRDDFRIIHMPAIGFWEKWNDIDTPNLLEGTALWESMWPKKNLLKIRSNNPKMFDQMYQGHEGVSDGEIFKPDWWQFYETPPPEIERVFTLQTVDTAYGSDQTSDYTVIATWTVTRHGVYLLDIHRSRPTFMDLIFTIKLKANEFKPRTIFIEDAGSGKSLIQTLSSTTMLPIERYSIGNRSKTNRAHAGSGLVQAGRVYLPVYAYWLNDFIDEHTAFPNGSRDDQVDTTTMVLDVIQNIPIFDDDDLITYNALDDIAGLLPDVEDDIGAFQIALF